MLVAFSVSMLFAADGPDPEAFCSSAKIGRPDPKLVIQKVFHENGKNYEQPNFVVGNKRISIREAHWGPTARLDKNAQLAIFVDKKQIATITIMGTYKGCWGCPFKLAPGTKPELKIDRKNETVSFLKK